MSGLRAAENIARLLGLAPVEAARLAADAERNRLAFDRSLRRGTRWWVRRRARAARSVPLPRDCGPAVVALPFSRAGLAWLRHLSLVHDGPLRVLRTELSEPHLRDHARRYGPLQLSTPIELIRCPQASRHNAVLVTFPDHTVGAADVNVPVPWFGEPMLFQTLESLLMRKHAAALFRGDGQRLERWTPMPSAGADAERDLRDEAAWLAEGAERAMAEAPAEYFGWHRVGRKCPRRLDRQHRLRTGALTGFLRSWACSVRDDAQELLAMVALVEGGSGARKDAGHGLGLAAARR
ncbi:MAG TPA: hypothetical protein VM576_08985 [Xanthomonadaceae bacterium]|nr:hypothetical protein [Xanthomonadaceae bacterium]